MNRHITIFCLIIISCSGGHDKDWLRQSAMKLRILDIKAERIYDLNRILIKENDPSIKKS